MNNRTIVLEIHGVVEAYALASAISERIDALQDSHERHEVIEYLSLYQLNTRIKPQIDALAKQERQT
jgi:hypothetical protein